MTIMLNKLLNEIQQQVHCVNQNIYEFFLFFIFSSCLRWWMSNLFKDLCVLLFKSPRLIKLNSNIFFNKLLGHQSLLKLKLLKIQTGDKLKEKLNKWMEKPNKWGQGIVAWYQQSGHVCEGETYRYFYSDIFRRVVKALIWLVIRLSVCRNATKSCCYLLLCCFVTKIVFI